MNRQIKLDRSWIVISVAAGFALLLTVTLFPRPVKAAINLQTRARTTLRGLEILDVRRHDETGFYVTIRNRYKTEVTAVAVETDSGATLYGVDLSSLGIGGNGPISLLPGQTYDLPCRVTVPGTAIILSAVVFKDNSAEGDPEQVRVIVDRRLGAKIQLTRIRPHLARLRKVDIGRIDAEFATVKRIAESLPIEADDGLPISKEVEQGMRYVREVIIRKLADLEKDLESEAIETYNDRGELRVLTRWEKFRRNLRWSEQEISDWLRRL